MRILHLLSNARWTGAAEPAVNLALGLRVRGHEVYFDCICGNSLSKYSISLGLPPLGKLSLRPNRPMDMLADLFSLRQFIRREKIEILHLHLSHDHWIGVLARSFSGLPTMVVRTVHNAAKIWSDPLHRRLFRHTDFTIVLSQRARDNLNWRLGLPAKQLGVVHGALNRDRFLAAVNPPLDRKTMGLKPGERLIGLASHLHENRGHKPALESYLRLRSSLPGVKLVFLGETDRHYYNRLKAEVERLGLTRDVLFWVDAPWQDWPKQMALLDLILYLAPGSEDSARAALEAMALAKPLVALDVGVLPEIVAHGRSGMLIPSLEPEPLAQAIRHILQEPGQAENMGRAGSEILAQRFLVSHQAAKVEEVYINLSRQLSVKM